MSQQYCVIYDEGRKTKVYTTVYDDHEGTRQRARCRWLHGNGCNARVVTAHEAMRLAAKD